MSPRRASEAAAAGVVERFAALAERALGRLPGGRGDGEQRDEGGGQLERIAVRTIDECPNSDDPGPRRTHEVAHRARRSRGGDDVLHHEHALVCRESEPAPKGQAPRSAALREHEACIARKRDRETERQGAHGRARDDFEVRVLSGGERSTKRAREPGALEEPELLHEDIGMAAGRQAEMPSLHCAGVVQGAADVDFVQVSTFTAPTSSETRVTP
jgi:hypothetical protein